LLFGHVGVSLPGRRRRSGDGAPDDAALRALARARVGMGALPADRQALAVAQAPVAAEVHQALDVQAGLAAEIALDLVALLQRLADAVDLVFGEILGALGRVELRRGADLLRGGVADPVQVLERDLDLLLAGKVHACNTRHSLLLNLAAACGGGSRCRSRAPLPCGGSPCTSRRSSSPKHGPSRLPPPTKNHPKIAFLPSRTPDCGLRRRGPPGPEGARCLTAPQCVVKLAAGVAFARVPSGRARLSARLGARAASA